MTRFTHTTLLGLLIAASPLGIGHGQVAPITVGPNVRVSAARPNITHDEVLLAADPSDARRLLACSIAGVNTDFSNVLDVAYVSSDGGRSWIPAVADSAGYSADPACAFGPDGHAYFTALERHYAFDVARVRAFVSADGGRSWRSVLVPGESGADRPFVVADQTPGTYRGRVYIAAQADAEGLDGKDVRLAGVSLWRSQNHAESFERAVQRFQKTDSTTFYPANVVVLSNGMVAMLVQEVESAKLREQRKNPQEMLRTGSVHLFTSRDGGETLSPAIHISDSYGDPSGVPSFAVDPGSAPFRDRLYAVWSDGRFGGRMQALLSYSADGKTWSTPRLVNDDWPDPRQHGWMHDASMPTVAVNKNGVVGVMWHDRRANGPDNTMDFVVRFAASLDGGETFQPSVVVSDAPSIGHAGERWALTAMDSGSRRMYSGQPSTGFRAVVARDHWSEGGHTNGIAADADGVFHLLWVDGRTGVHQVWTAAVTIGGAGVKHGAPELAELEDLSARIDLRLSAPVYDPAKRTLTVSARLENVSADTVRGPLWARVLTIASDVGVARLIGGSGTGRGEGTALDFTPLLPREGLAQHEASAPRTLQFALTDLRSEFDLLQSLSGYSVNGSYRGVLTLEGMILGKKPSALAERSERSPSR